MSMTVRSIYRYPVKGLSAEALPRVALSAGECVPHDRRFAIAHAATSFNPEKPEWLQKTHFFMLMRDEKLAQLRTRFDETTGSFTIERSGQPALSARITEADGRKSLERFFAEFLADRPGGLPKLVEAPGHAFADAKRKPNATTDKYVSLINLASVRDLERVVQAPVDPIRFRANVYFEGAPAWSELDWTGAELRMGEARLRVVSPITRCLATTVNPTTAIRDIEIPRILQKEFAHNCMGSYAEVAEGGEVAANDRLERLD